MSEIYLSRKTQLKLTESQKKIIDEMIFIRIKLWNKLIEVYNPIIIDKLENKIKNILPSQTELEKYFKDVNNFKYDLSMINKRLIRSTVLDYLEAWKMCFRMRNRRKPHFHSSFNSELSVPFYDCGTKIKETKKNGICFSLSTMYKEKNILFCEDMKEFIGVVILVYSISRRNDKYYISLTFKLEKEKIQSQNNQVGCDWGLKEFLTCSNEKVYSLPKSLIRQEIRIKNLQRILSKKCKGSKNGEKIKSKLDDAWKRYTNIRKDFIEKVSFELLSENNLIALEDLDIQEMIKRTHKNRRRNIYKNCFNIFRVRMIQKSERFESQVIFVGKYFPSSKKCCICGKKHNMPVSKRVMSCDCGNEIDRDLNASINILNEGLRLVS